MSYVNFSDIRKEHPDTTFTVLKNSMYLLQKGLSSTKMSISLEVPNPDTNATSLYENLVHEYLQVHVEAQRRSDRVP